jgi:hypothetical protein
MPENCVLRIQQFQVPESNLFLMTRFRGTQYHSAISEAVNDAVSAFGLEFLIASDPNLDERVLWNRVLACMEACRFGIAVFEEIDEALSPNVTLELGYMMALGRKCLMLKEKRMPELSADLRGFLCGEFDAHNIRDEILGRVAVWLKQIGVRRRDHEKLIVFVSYGGQDRCAIARAITHHLLAADGCALDVRIESRSAWTPTGPGAAKSE